MQTQDTQDTVDGIDITAWSREVKDDPTLGSDLRVTTEQFPFLKEGVVLYSPKGVEAVTGRGGSTIRKYMAQGLRSYRVLGARVITLQDLQHFMRHILKDPGRPRKQSHNGHTD